MWCTIRQMFKSHKCSKVMSCKQRTCMSLQIIRNGARRFMLSRLCPEHRKANIYHRECKIWDAIGESVKLCKNISTFKNSVLCKCARLSSSSSSLRTSLRICYLKDVFTVARFCSWPWLVESQILVGRKMTYVIISNCFVARAEHVEQYGIWNLKWPVGYISYSLPLYKQFK